MVGADRVSMSVQARRRVPGLRQTLEQPLPQVRAGIVLGRRTAQPAPPRRVAQRAEQESREAGAVPARVPVTVQVTAPMRQPAGGSVSADMAEGNRIRPRDEPHRRERLARGSPIHTASAPASGGRAS